MNGSLLHSRCRQNLKFGDFTKWFCGELQRNARKFVVHVQYEYFFSFLTNNILALWRFRSRSRSRSRSLCLNSPLSYTIQCVNPHKFQPCLCQEIGKVCNRVGKTRTVHHPDTLRYIKINHKELTQRRLQRTCVPYYR